MRINIGKKITGAFLIGIGIYVLSVGIAYLVINDLLRLTNQMDAIARKLNLTSDLQFDINKLLGPVDSYLITGNVAERDRFDQLLNKTSEILKKLEAYEGGSKWEVATDTINRDAVQFSSLAIEILFIDRPVGNQKASLLHKELNAFAERLVLEADELHNIAEEHMQRMPQDAERKRAVVRVFLIVTLGVALVSLIPVSLYLKMFITDPILKLHDGAQLIGTGRFSHRLSIKTGDEIEDLAEEFNRMATSLEHARGELDRRILELYTLYNVSKVLSATFETEELLNQIVKNVSESLKIHRVMLMLLDERTQELHIASCADFREYDIDIYGARFKIGEGLYGWVAMSGDARLVRDVDKETGLIEKDILSPDIQSIIAVPFGTRGKVLGVLCAFKNRPDSFTWEDLELMKAVAEHVALALENARLYKETKMMAITDGLTGAYNHRFFVQKLNDEVKKGERYSRPLSLIMLDVDSFKHYNDRHGHQGGDEVLRMLAEVVTKALRSTDIVARYGGEEFCVIVPETDKTAAVQAAEKIRKTIEGHPFPFKETQPGGNLTVSLGVASYPIDAQDAEQLMKTVDDALYRAKEGGRNRVEAA